MAQIGFFAAAAASGIGGMAILLAWNRYDRGPDAVDDADNDGMALYSWIAPISGAFLVKLKTKSPVHIPQENCPNYPDGYPDRNLINRFEVKPGGVALTSIADFTLDIFEESTLIYSAVPAGASIKFELADNSIINSAISIQEIPTLQAWEDPLEGLAGLINFDLPSKEIWRTLMTPNQPLEWF